MQFVPTQHYFVESAQSSAFFPWANLLLVGGLWAYDVPNESTRCSLIRITRLYCIGSIAFFAFAAVIGVYYGHPITAFWIGMVVPWTVYFFLAYAQVRKLVRISVDQCFPVFAAQFDNVRLTQGVLLGLLGAAFTIAFEMYSLLILPFTIFFVVNAGLSAYVLHDRRMK